MGFRSLFLVCLIFLFFSGVLLQDRVVIKEGIQKNGKKDGKLFVNQNEYVSGNWTTNCGPNTSTLTGDILTANCGKVQTERKPSKINIRDCEETNVSTNDEGNILECERYKPGKTFVMFQQ